MRLGALPRLDPTPLRAGDPRPGHPCQVCDPSRSQTSFSIASNGAACDTANVCTGLDHCVDGVCVGNNDCMHSGEDQCHVAVCDLEAGHCVLLEKPDGTVCREFFCGRFGFNCGIEDGTCCGGNCSNCRPPDECCGGGGGGGGGGIFF